MSRIAQRVPMLLSGTALLAGALTFGAVTTYYYKDSVVRADCDVSCDAEDPDDCSTDCPCHDPTTNCRVPR